MAREDFHTTNH